MANEDMCVGSRTVGTVSLFTTSVEHPIQYVSIRVRSEGRGDGTFASTELYSDEIFIIPSKV